MGVKHSFDLGEYVNVFQMHPSKGLLFEGRAAIVNLADADEYYEVRFDSDLKDYASTDDCPTYQRFIDREGQADAQKYIRQFNKKIGYKAA